jgi:hypothetical protein
MDIRPEEGYFCTELSRNLRTMKALELGPDWLAAEMPPGYNTRLLEIQRLSAELKMMGQFGRLLWTVGDELADAVREAFVALKFDVASAPAMPTSSVTVNLDSRRRLLLHISSSDAAIEKKSPDLAHLFRMLHELANDDDRIVLVANTDPATPPAHRRDAVDTEAMKLLRRLGANLLLAPTLFAVWTLSLQDRDRARASIERLHAQDGGIFELR